MTNHDIRIVSAFRFKNKGANKSKNNAAEIPELVTSNMPVNTPMNPCAPHPAMHHELRNFQSL